MSDAIISDMISDHPRLAPLARPLQQAMAMLLTCQRSGGWIYTCGNGGSAADADHIVGEFLKGFRAPRMVASAVCASLCAIDSAWNTLAPKLQGGLRACSLNAHGAGLSAIANDQHPELIFAQQLIAMGRPGDVLIGLSTSGESRNVLRALQTARALGIGTIAFTGSRPSSMDAVSDVLLKAPATETWRVQECHLPLYHALCAGVELALE
jgi:D-sedoheptulose 7-phosphate isomerase